VIGCAVSSVGGPAGFNDIAAGDLVGAPGRRKSGGTCCGRPTIRAALLAGAPWLDVFCPGCGTIRAIDLWRQSLSPSGGRKLARRGLRGVKLVISDAHEGIKGAVAKVLNATWQRCRVRFMRNVLAHAGRQGRRVVSAFIATAFAQDDAEGARAQWRRIADQLRPKLPKLAAFLDEAETDVLAYMTFPAQHRAKLHSTNPLERVNGEIKRRTEVVGIFPKKTLLFAWSARSCSNRQTRRRQRALDSG
jgi:hypothetical protein